MTYETWIGIEIAGIRRGLRLTLGYHVEHLEGATQPVLDSVCLRREKKQLPDSWIFDVIGPRQLRELQGDLLKHWTAQTAA